MIIKRSIISFIITFTVLVGSIPRSPFLDGLNRNFYEADPSSDATISRAEAQVKEDAMVKDTTALGRSAEAVFVLCKKVYSSLKTIPSFILAGFISILEMDLFWIQFRCYAVFQSKRKKKNSVIQYIHDSDGRKRRSLSFCEISLCR